MNAGLIRATLSPLKYDSVLGQDLSRNQRCKKDFLEWKLIKDCTIIIDNHHCIVTDADATCKAIFMEDHNGV